MKIHRCIECKEYTMHEEHCGKKTASVLPPKYRPQDKYASYTRDAKETERKNQGLL